MRVKKYPAWRYHVIEPPKIIQSAADEAPGWLDTPAKAKRAAMPKVTRRVKARRKGTAK